MALPAVPALIKLKQRQVKMLQSNAICTKRKGNCDHRCYRRVMPLVLTMVKDKVTWPDLWSSSQTVLRDFLADYLWSNSAKHEGGQVW